MPFGSKNLRYFSAEPRKNVSIAVLLYK